MKLIFLLLAFTFLIATTTASVLDYDNTSDVSELDFAANQLT